ncbi:MAG: hypothetical protein KDE56_19195 [Anaerolineales bacterium]|nr:hypothetical protein [Anaerolineales bacterium]
MASRFSQQFSHRHVILPVIHVVDLAQAERNARIAYDAGADGVFLINHDISSQALLAVYAELTAVFPHWWLGVNCLDLDAAATFAAVPPGMAGVWVDNAGIDETRTDQPAAERVRQAQQQHGWTGLYFGGVAFKYQREVADLEWAAQTAVSWMDVITTSGPGTGHAASVAKIRTMKQAIGSHPLAIASGITPENVGDYLPHADCFLVATGISHRFDQFDPARVQALVQRIRAGIQKP